MSGAAGVTARALLHLPAQIRRGQPFEARALIAHPMETGFRAGPDGRVVPRSILRRLHVTLDGQTLVDLQLHPAVAANPYFAFDCVVERRALLVLHWQGDDGVDQRLERMLEPL